MSHHEYPYDHIRSGKKCRWSEKHQFYHDERGKKVTSRDSSVESRESRGKRKPQATSSQRDRTGESARGDGAQKSKAAERRSSTSVDQTGAKLATMHLRSEAGGGTSQQYTQQPQRSAPSGQGKSAVTKAAADGSGGSGGQQKSSSGAAGGSGGKRREIAQVPKPNKASSRDIAFGTVLEIVRGRPTSTTSTITPTSAYPASASLRLSRFVVIAANMDTEPNNFLALPIKTYNGYGLAYPGVVKRHHAIIHTGRRAHDLRDDERPRRLENGRLEAGARAQPIRVEPLEPDTALDDMSRLNFFEYERFSKRADDMYIFGHVHQDSRGPLLYQYQAVWGEIQAASNPQPAPQHPGPGPSGGQSGGSSGGTSGGPSVGPSAGLSGGSSGKQTGAAGGRITAGQSAGPSTQQQNRAASNTQGVLSLAEFRQQYQAIIEQARKLGTTKPKTLTEEQELYLARNVQKRREVFGNLQDRWREELAEGSDSD